MTTRVAAKPLPIQPGSWTLAVLPDTQHYSRLWPHHFETQTKWLVENHAALNIKYVLHEGDIVNTAADTQQWTNSRVAMDRLNGVVPYVVSPGNHDYGGQGANAIPILTTELPGETIMGGERRMLRRHPSAVFSKNRARTRRTIPGTRLTRTASIG